MTNVDGDFPAPGEFILVSEVEEGMDSASSFKNVNYLLGCGYHRAWKGWLFEVIAYDRCLSLDEVKVMEKYLVEKWFNAEPFADTLSALDANGTDLSLAGGASLDLAGQPLAVNGEVAFDLGTGTAVAPFTVTGDLTLGALARLVYSNGQNLDSSRKWPTLQVTGTVEGNFAAVTGVPGRFASSRDATGWSLAPSGMLLIFR